MYNSKWQITIISVKDVVSFLSFSSRLPMECRKLHAPFLSLGGNQYAWGGQMISIGQANSAWEEATWKEIVWVLSPGPRDKLKQLQAFTLSALVIKASCGGIHNPCSIIYSILFYPHPGTNDHAMCFKNGHNISMNKP